MCADRQSDKLSGKALFACAIMFLSSFAPSHAGARDEALHFSATGNHITVSYLYKERRIADNMAQHYCAERFASKARLKPAGCTKMLPMEINRCAIRGIANNLLTISMRSVSVTRLRNKEQEMKDLDIIVYGATGFTGRCAPPIWRLHEPGKMGDSRSKCR